VSSILILIPSFDNKHTINVIVYIGFDVYAQFQRSEIEECQGMYWKKTTYQYLKPKEWRQKKDKMCSLENIRSEYFLLIYIYIYIYKDICVN